MTADSTPTKRRECCHKTVFHHCDDCPYVPVERCNCQTCIAARDDGRRYKGEGNTPMQKEDYDGSCQ